MFIGFCILRSSINVMSVAGDNVEKEKKKFA
jgi:hypothetical protein